MSFRYSWPMGLTLAVSLSAAGMAKPPTASEMKAEKAAIIELRRANNAAIAASDLDGTMRMAADDYVLVGGNDGIIRSKEEMRQRWADDFASPHPANRCVRQPANITVGQAGGVLRAAEIGNWRCPAERPSGAATPYGTYLAHWSKRSTEWRLVSHNYVTLGCRGPGC
ncbi:YybH family protein [Sphingomonas oligophenolica]|uniref:DUF4440 domain-containing protein n=1 Tax=Sphingomonas oligophenolica TaxID=301154 RepID=A0A502CL44_9SPHN|nr:DUF4440 domain-containing protein [Sphingomonas oligophenolica]TPG13638.1 DUF4440 domain-containing protein [Sphingomonas oligophenolica]